MPGRTTRRSIVESPNESNQDNSSIRSSEFDQNDKQDETEQQFLQDETEQSLQDETEQQSIVDETEQQSIVDETEQPFLQDNIQQRHQGDIRNENMAELEANRDGVVAVVGLQYERYIDDQKFEDIENIIDRLEIVGDEESDHLCMRDLKHEEMETKCVTIGDVIMNVDQNRTSDVMICMLLSSAPQKKQEGGNKYEKRQAQSKYERIVRFADLFSTSRSQHNTFAILTGNGHCKNGGWTYRHNSDNTLSKYRNMC